MTVFYNVLAHFLSAYFFKIVMLLYITVTGHYQCKDIEDRRYLQKECFCMYSQLVSNEGDRKGNCRGHDDIDFNDITCKFIYHVKGFYYVIWIPKWMNKVHVLHIIANA